MGLSASTTWEVRVSGSDLNGGGYVSGGVDYSVQDSAVLSLSDLACTGSASTTLTSATGGFTAAMIGNLIQIASGTGFTAGFYQITARASSTSVTLDRTPATSSSAASGGVGKVGGGLASPGKAAGAAVASNTVYVKAGATYNITSATANVAGGCVNAPASSYWYGYSATRGDGGQATLRASGISSATLFSAQADAPVTVENLILDGNSLSSIRGLFVEFDVSGHAYNCVARNCTNTGFYVRTQTNACFLVAGCEATGCSQGVYFHSYGAFLWGCNVHDNAGAGLAGDNTLGGVWNCAFTGNGGGGIVATFVYANYAIKDCTFRNNAGDGFTIAGGTAASDGGVMFANCVFAGNTGYGVGGSASNRLVFLGCAFYGNSSGKYVAETNSLTVGEVVLSADPFVNGAGGDLRPNNAAGGGAALRGAGWPPALPGLTPATARDVGAYQHATPALGLTVTGTPPVLTWDADPRSTTYDVLGYLAGSYTVLTAATTATTYTDNSGTGYTAYTVTGRP